MFLFDPPEDTRTLQGVSIYGPLAVKRFPLTTLGGPGMYFGVDD